MALPMAASSAHTPLISVQGQVVDLVDLCSKLEDRLFSEEHAIAAMRARGDDTSVREAAWVRVLRRYERVCDLLAADSGHEHATAA
jgi:hypothetical protein